MLIFWKYWLIKYSIVYTDRQKKRYNQNQSFIQAVISSNYVEIINKNYSQYYVWKESQTLFSGAIKLA